MDAGRRAQLMFLATLAMFGAIAFLAWDGDRRLLQSMDAVTVRTGGGAYILSWRGEVKAPMARRIAEALESLPEDERRVVLELSSPGGLLAEGRVVIDVLEDFARRRPLDTRVRSGEICLSMCVPIFLTGENRIAAPSSRFMFHEPTAHDLFTDEEIRRPAFEQRMDSERFFRRYFENSPMNPEWGERLKAEWVGVDVWKTGRDLVEERSGVVTELR